MALSLIVAMLSASLVLAQTGNPALVINGKPLDPKEMDLIYRLERQYGVKHIPGRYWYDPKTGLYGAQGRGAFGQILPNLPIGGRLQENASNGDTGVWVNGRQLHRTDVAYLRQCTPVIPGRYWLDSQGNGGVEGGPVQWNLVRLCAVARQQAGGSLRRSYGSVLSDGATTGAMFRSPNGDVYGVTCGPDGGCIY